jgi:hypothetical protein
VRGVEEAGKLSLPGPLLRLGGPTHSTGFEAGGCPISLHSICHSLLTSFPVPRKIKRDEKRREQKRKRNMRKFQDLEGAALPSSLSHGGARLDTLIHYTEPSAKNHEAWVHDGGGARGLSGAGGPCTPHASGRLCGVLYSVL